MTLTKGKQTYMTRADEGLGEGVFDSIAWLFSEHVKAVDDGTFNFALVHGNEDSPSIIDLWITEPNYDTEPDMVWTMESEEGNG